MHPTPLKALFSAADEQEVEDSASDFAGWMLASMSSGVVAVDNDGAVVVLNAEARRILGCPPDDAKAALGRDCREVLGRQPAVAQLLIGVLEGRGELARAELALDAAEAGAASTIGFSVSPVRDAQRRLRGAAMLFRDLTPFERADERDRLRERLAALGEMAAGLAHEIRNPLAGMEVLVGLLKRRLPQGSEEQRLVAQLTGELRAVAETVAAGLDFVRPVALERTRTDVVELVEEALAAASSRIAFGGRVERKYDDVPELMADAERLRVVITNLIVNAFEAMAECDAPDSCLTLSVQRHVVVQVGRSVRVGSDGRAVLLDGGPSREVAIGVSDTGPGIPHDLQARIFYPFFTTKQSGSGVGLASAQKVVASHGGALEVDSREGRGAAFRIRLPVHGVEP